MPRIWASTAYSLALFVVSTHVAAQNVDEMAKWTALTVVHYRVLAEYSGETTLFAEGWPAVQATDRVEIEFDWDQSEMQLAGSAKITNSPTRHGAPAGIDGCPAPRVDGTLEVLTAVSISGQPGSLEVATTTENPAGTYPGPNEEGPCGASFEVAAKSTTGTMSLRPLPAMMLAMGPPGTGSISQDGKSLVMKSENWTWTFTPTPVR